MGGGDRLIEARELRKNLRAWRRVMRAGKFAEMGLVEQVLHRPVDAYTRELLAAAPEVPRTTLG